MALTERQREKEREDTAIRERRERDKDKFPAQLYVTLDNGDADEGDYLFLAHVSPDEAGEDGELVAIYERRELRVKSVKHDLR